jgi:hypothetical protein
MQCVLLVAAEDGNRLAGTLPAEISLLTGLKRFIAPVNDLKGEFGIALGGLSLLDTVVLSSNKLNGTLPVNMIENNSGLGMVFRGGLIHASIR